MCDLHNFPDIFSLLSPFILHFVVYISKTNTRLAILTVICAVGPQRLGPRRLKEAMEWLFEAYVE